MRQHQSPIARIDIIPSQVMGRAGLPSRSVSIVRSTPIPTPTPPVVLVAGKVRSGPMEA